MTNNEPMKVSSTRLSSIGFCPKAHHYQYELKLQKKGSNDALDLGLSVHTALQEFYKTGKFPQLPDDLGEVGDKLVSNVTAYKLMAQMQDRFEVVDVEKEFTLPLEGLNAVLTGFIDAVVRIDGQLWVMEHKTCSQHWSDERIGMAFQHVLYELAAEEIYGEPVRGTVYNFLRTTKRGGEFHTDVKRVTVPADDAVRAAVWDDLEQKLQAIQVKYKARNPGQHCKWCSMFALCQTELVGGDTAYVIENYYQPRNKDDIEDSTDG